MLTSKGLDFLTTSDEKQEIKIVTASRVSVTSKARLAEIRGHKIVFEYMQSDFNGGYLPYWRVCDPTSPNYQSSLSQEGLKHWKVNVRSGGPRAS